MSRSHGLYSGKFGTIATFRYPQGIEHTLVASSRAHAYAQARRRWGDGWIGEPCFSTPASIHADITGATRRRHGGGMTMQDRTRESQRRLRREGRA